MVVQALILLKLTLFSVLLLAALAQIILKINFSLAIYEFLLSAYFDRIPLNCRYAW